MKVTRKSRVGINVIEFAVDEPKILHIKGLGEKESKKYKKQLPLYNVIDLETGEEGIIWINGGIKGAFGSIGGLETAIGKTYEITFKGLVPLGDTDQEVNKYEIFEVDVEG